MNQNQSRLLCSFTVKNKQGIPDTISHTTFNLGPWCNSSISVSNSEDEGAIPSGPAKLKRIIR